MHNELYRLTKGGDFLCNAAHRKEHGEQTIPQHLEGTADRAQEFASVFKSGGLARFCALLHDIGKYSEAFQSRIHGAPVRTDHSTAGAQTALRLLPRLGKLPAYCIAGHHTGLPAGGYPSDTQADSTLEGRLKRVVDPYDRYFAENKLPSLPQPPPIKPIGKGGFFYAFFTRMLYSCLVDADYLDTEDFMSGGKVMRNGFADLSVLNQKLDQKLAKFGGGKRPIDQKRCEILQDCVRAAAGEPGLFSLTVPTGGGKTISSLAFALKHALKNGLKRVIYVIPYTNIIEQNANVFSDILGEKNVLQHHSNFDFSSIDEDGVGSLCKLASENWDAPLIVTTNVQFFESLYANKPSRCRKIHNIAGSVIIFDEAQMFPTQYLNPCVRAISELVYNYRCTAVLCSATQPVLQFPKEISVREICRDPLSLYQFFRRTKIVNHGTLSDASLLDALEQHTQALCIVNTRAHARRLYMGLSSDAFHLSTLMCPKHRKETIKQMKNRLSGGLPCRVVSTRLIEAGVDIDFPVVYRCIAGIDSLVQSAGRCNREMKAPSRDVFVFESLEEDIARLPHSLQRPAQIAKEILRHYPDILSPQAIRAYFTRLFEMEGDNGLDVKTIVPSLEAGGRSLRFDFPKAAEDFKLIDCPSRPIVIPFDDGAEKLITDFKKQPGCSLIRALQPYTVSVYPHEYALLNDAGVLETIHETAFLSDRSLYDMHTGLNIPSGGGRAIFQ